MADGSESAQQALAQAQKWAAESRLNQASVLLTDKQGIASILTQNKESLGPHDPNACQDLAALIDDCDEGRSSSFHKRGKSMRIHKRPRKLQDESMDMLQGQSSQKRQKQEGDSQISLSPLKVDKDDPEDFKDSEYNSASQQDMQLPGQTNKKNYGHKKQNFTAVQTQILKQWFYENADNPYLKEENRRELADKTGLLERQVSNWFTNVRKRIWQPLKKKNKSKNVNDVVLKVKLKMDADKMHPSASVCSSSQGSINKMMKDPSKFDRHVMKKRHQHHLSQMGGMIEEMTQTQHRQQQQLSQLQATAGHNPFNIHRAPTPQQNVLASLQQSLNLNQFQQKLPQSNTISQVTQVQQQQQQQQSQFAQLQQSQLLQPQQIQHDKTQSQLLSILDQLVRPQQLNQNTTNILQQKSFQSILKDPSSITNKPAIIQPVQQQQDNQSIMQMGHKVQNPVILLDKQQNNLAQQIVQQPQQVHWSQNNQINSILSLQKRPSVQQQPPRLQPNNLQEQLQQFDMSKFKKLEALQQEINQKQNQATKHSLLPQSQLVQVGQTSNGTLQALIQGDTIGQIAAVQKQKSNLMINNMIAQDIVPDPSRTQTFDNNNIFDQGKRPQDNIINTQMTQKESQQGEDLRSHASKFHVCKNLIEIDFDFKKIDKDQSAGHTNSVVEKDKGAINFGVMSDTSLNQNWMALALNQFLSKKMRSKEKMKNVEQWRQNQIEFAFKNKTLLEDPAKDEQNKNLYKKLDPKKIELIENEFIEHQKMVDQLANQKAQDKEKDNNNLSSRAEKKGRNSSKRRQDGGSKGEDEHMNDVVDVVSLHHSKSLDNNRSLSQFDDQASENKVNTINAPFQFIPIVLVSCPNVVKGGECKCGYDGFYPANDFYKNQLQSFITNQGQLLNKEPSSQNNSGNSGTGGSGGSNDSGPPQGRIPSSSNNQSNGNSWQTTADQKHPFVALLNQFNQQANNTISDQKKKGTENIEKNFQNALKGVRNMTELIQKLTQTYSQVKEKLNKKHQEQVQNNAGTQATLNQTGGGTAPAQSNQQDEMTGRQLMENGPFERPQCEVDRRGAPRQSNQHIIPPSVNFISHLEQASLLKNQLEVLNEITNQFHELMRLDKIKQKIVQIQRDQGRDGTERINDPAEDVDQAPIEQEQPREEPVRPVAEAPVALTVPQQQPQINKAQYHTSDTEQLAPARQGQTLNQRIKRNSRTMSEHDHKSSQNQNSHANMGPPALAQPNQAIGAGQLNNQNTVLVNQLQMVLNALYNAQRCPGNGNRPDEQKPPSNLQIVQLLKRQAAANRATRTATGSVANTAGTANRSARPTDAVVSFGPEVGITPPSASNNWLSHKNMRSTTAESAIFSMSNNKNCENEQLAQQTTNQIKHRQFPGEMQSNFEAPIDSCSVRQNTQTVVPNMNQEASLGNVIQQQQNRVPTLGEKVQARVQDPTLAHLLPSQPQQQVYKVNAQCSGNSSTINNVDQATVNVNQSDKMQWLQMQLLQTQSREPQQDLRQGGQIEQNGQVVPQSAGQMFEQPQWTQNQQHQNQQQ